MDSVNIGFCLLVTFRLPFQFQFDIGNEIREEIANLLRFTISTATHQPLTKLYLIAPAAQVAARLCFLGSRTTKGLRPSSVRGEINQDTLLAAAVRAAAQVECP